MMRINHISSARKPGAQSRPQEIMQRTGIVWTTLLGMAQISAPQCTQSSAARSPRSSPP